MIDELSQLGEVLKRVTAEYQAVIDKYSLQFKRIFDELKENEDVEKESFRLWAYYGWTTIDLETFGFYRTPPLSQEDADRRSLMLFSHPGSVRRYFEIRDIKCNIRYFDLEEALSSYEAGYYKSCAMLLVSMIDRQLLQYQRREKRDNIKVGRGALEIVEENAKGEDIFEKLVQWNTLYFLKYLFDSDNRHRNFQNEPNTINRNFLMHGMTNRTVSKTDCIKLFVALKNVSNLISGYNKTYEEEST